MTNNELRNYLIDKKAINDFEDEKPFVGTYLPTIVELKHSIEQDLIEKACDWIKNNIHDYLSSDGYSDVPGFRQYVTEDFYEDFNKAMQE